MIQESTISREKNGRSKVTIIIDPAAATAAQEAAVIELGKDIKMDGFRPGAAPAEALREKLNDADVMQHALRTILPEVMQTVALEHELKPVIPPAVDATSIEPLTIEITFVEKPAAKVGKLKLDYEKKEPAVDEKHLQDMIDYVLKQHQTSLIITTGAEDGNRVTMDFHGEDENGAEVEGIRTSGHQVVIGSKVLLPGFEDELIGLTEGGEKSFTLIFPEKSQAEHLRGKPVTFHVKVSQVEKMITPELTDEFAKANLQVESVADFKGKIEESLLEQEKQFESRRREQAIMEAIAAATKVDLVDELVHDEFNHLKGEFIESLNRQGSNFEQWLEQTQKTEEDADKEMTEEAKKRLAVRYGVTQLVDDKKIEVTDEEVAPAVVEAIAAAPADQQEAVTARFAAGSPHYEQLRWEKRVEKLMTELAV